MRRFDLDGRLGGLIFLRSAQYLSIYRPVAGKAMKGWLATKCRESLQMANWIPSKLSIL
jgi:hypothetical protein